MKIIFENIDEGEGSKFEYTLNDFNSLDAFYYPIKQGLISLGYKEEAVEKFLNKGDKK